MSRLIPKDAEFEARVRASFARQTAMATLGIEIVCVGAGEVELKMPYAADYTQQHGSLMPDNAAVLTVEFKTNLLAPARSDYFLFRAHVVKPGRTVTVCDAQAFAIEDNKEKLVATMTGTLMALFDRDGIAH